LVGGSSPSSSNRESARMFVENLDTKYDRKILIMQANTIFSEMETEPCELMRCCRNIPCSSSTGRVKGLYGWNISRQPTRMLKSLETQASKGGRAAVRTGGGSLPLEHCDDVVWCANPARVLSTVPQRSHLNVRFYHTTITVMWTRSDSHTTDSRNSDGCTD
jgi:hypothetical protein